MKNSEDLKLIPSGAGTTARRNFLMLSGAVGTSLLLGACSGPTRPPSTTNQAKPAGTPASPSSEKDEENDSGADVGAVEDLMREHGVIRRALLVYDSVARKLRTKPADVSGSILQDTAKLFRAFGEDYHEKKLEETYIFPAVKNTQGPAAVLPDILIVQHQRGREITDFILSVSKDAKIATGNVEPLAKALESMILMYQHHTAREDTVLFPAWAATLGDDKLEKMGDTFEDIEHREFGQDGFESAVKQISQIETELGIADISQFTPEPMSTGSTGNQ